MAETVPSLFPFPRVRTGQKAFLGDARRALKAGKHLVAHAPTGLGKTAVGLAAGLEAALPEGNLVLFLTSKQSQHRIAIETVQRIRTKAPLRVVDVIGKHAMCLQPDAPRGGRAFHAFCDLKVGTRSCAFHQADASAAVGDVRARPLHVQELVATGTRHAVCPHKLALEAAKDAHLVVCDYNYVFSDLQERILSRIGRSLGDTILVVDEAHNLPDRIRGQMGGDLGVFDLMRAAKEARPLDPTLASELHAFAQALQTVLRNHRKETRVGRDFITNVLENAANGPVIRPKDLAADCGHVGNALVRAALPTVLLDVASFLRRWEEREEAVLRIAAGGTQKRLSYRLLDPAIVSRGVFDAVRASVVMSGTLHPTAMYADLLGLDATRRVLRAYPSPFPPENRRLLVTPRVTTAYGRRDERMYRSIAREIERVAAGVPGNVAAFFPSYDLLERVLMNVRWSSVPKDVLVEKRGWTKEERDAALTWLRDHEAKGGLLAGVLGGGLSEGVDYRGNLLRAVCVVGLPLSPPTLEVDALRGYYTRKFGGNKGYEYAVVYPALNKVLQAAGRPIRGEEDRAIVVLMDRRYLDARYAAGMPPDFRYDTTQDVAREAVAFFGREALSSAA